MELASRIGADRFVAAGGYRALAARLRTRVADFAEVRAAVVAAFDRRTRMLPFLGYDRFMFPAGARTIAAALHEAGFRSTRAVFQLWNPRFRPSQALLDGRPLEMLLVSSMSLHMSAALELVRDARTMGAERPLVIAGGAMAIYEPFRLWTEPDSAPDVAVTGEVYVLLDLLNVLAELRGRGESMRAAFERARGEGALESVPGLVYLAPGASPEEPTLVDTGLQRLVESFDELPHEVTGLGLLEPPHRGSGLAPQPLPDSKVLRHLQVLSLQITQGCRFRCAYCPIPAYNQKSWRSRSPDAVVHELRTVHERFGIKYFFGTDDNFFNVRDTAAELLEAMANARACDRPFGERIRFATEATEIDTFKNRDLLPLARAAGMRAIWFGVEDLTATLVKKGQTPSMTVELFRLLGEHKIAPMVMLMFHEGQPFFSRGSVYGLFNQVDFLRRAGAISLHVTAHTPAVGTREYEETYRSRRVIERIGRALVSDSMIDGNHVIVVGSEAPWKRQVKLLGGYAAFYNPWNFVRALERDRHPLRRYRFGYQALGMVGTVWTAARIAPHLFRLMTGKVTCHTGPPPAEPLPVRRAQSAHPRLPLLDLAHHPLRGVGGELR